MGTVHTRLSPDRVCAQHAGSQCHACLLQAGRVRGYFACRILFQAVIAVIFIILFFFTRGVIPSLGTVHTRLSQDRVCAQHAGSQCHACLLQAGWVYRASHCDNIYSRPGHAYIGVLGLTNVWPQARRPIYRHTAQAVC